MDSDTGTAIFEDTPDKYIYRITDGEDNKTGKNSSTIWKWFGDDVEVRQWYRVGEIN